MEVLDKIILLLRQNSHTQKELTDYLGLEKSTFSSWKSGKSQSYNKYIPQIAEFLETTPDYLLGWADDPIDYESTEENLNAPLDVIRHFDGDAEKIYNFQNTVKKDHNEESDIIILNRKAKDLSPEKLRLLIKMAEAMMEEESDE